jgi:tungstate transport system substrate-binding protein
MAVHNGVNSRSPPIPKLITICMLKHIALVFTMNRNQTMTLGIAIVILVAAGGLYVLQSQARSGKTSLVVSTTTSLYDTGVLDAVEEAFEEESDVDLYFISVGTGLAITHAQRGDADMILVHAPSKERAFMEDGYGVCRKIIAYNFFSIVGPGEDPAGIAGMSPVEALHALVEMGRDGAAVWVSRGDDSGTHTKEKGLWAEAGFDVNELTEEGWYREAGTGMGKTLQIADEFGAYTLTDMGTYLKYYKDGLIGLEVQVGAGEELINVYSAIAVSEDSNPDTNFEGAIEFIEFLVSEEGQSIFAGYGVETYGTALFNPAVGLLRDGGDPTTASWVETAAYFDGSECPAEYRAGQTKLYQ